MQSATYEGQLYLDAVTKSLLTTLLKYLTFYTRLLEIIHATIIYSTFKGSNPQNKKKVLYRRSLFTCLDIKYLYPRSLEAVI